MGFISDAEKSNKVIIVAGATYDHNRQEFTFNDCKFTLDPKSNSLFELLLDNPEKTFSANEILISIWGNEFISKNVVTNRISMIRTFFCDHVGTDMEDVIITYPRKGYSIKRGAVFLNDEKPNTPHEDILTNEERDALVYEATSSLSLNDSNKKNDENKIKKSSVFHQIFQSKNKTNLIGSKFNDWRLLWLLLFSLLSSFLLYFSFPPKTIVYPTSYLSYTDLKGKSSTTVIFNGIRISTNSDTLNIDELDLCYRLINAVSNINNVSVVNLYSPRFFTGVHNKKLCPGGEQNKPNENINFKVSITLDSRMMLLLIQDNLKGKKYRHEIELTDIGSMVANAAYYIHLVLEELEADASKEDYRLAASDQLEEYLFSMQSRMIVNGGHDEMLDDLVYRMKEHEKYNGLSFENKSWLIFLLAYSKKYDDALSMYNYFQDDGNELQNPLLTMVLAYVAYEKKDYSLAAYHYFSTMALMTKKQQTLATQCFLSHDEGQTCTRLWELLLNQKSSFWDALIKQYCKMVVEIRNKSSVQI